MEPKLSDIMLSLSDMKNQVTNLSNRLDLLTPTPTKSIFEQSPIDKKEFERAMENLDIDSNASAPFGLGHLPSFGFRLRPSFLAFFALLA